MPEQELKRDISTILLKFFASRLPDQSSQWARAMLAELEALPDRRERMAWAVSSSCGLARIWLEASLRSIFVDPVKPWSVILIAAYHAIFCFVLLYVIVSQIPRITSSWIEAFFPILFMVF